MWRWKSTKKQSETSLLTSTIEMLAAELRQQSESQRKLSEKLLDLVTERDAQIRLVLESKFEQRIVMQPARQEAREEPADTAYLQDVTEMAKESTVIGVDKDSKAYTEATAELETELSREFEELAAEHTAAHGQEAQA